MDKDAPHEELSDRLILGEDEGPPESAPRARPAQCDTNTWHFGFLSGALAAGMLALLVYAATSGTSTGAGVGAGEVSFVVRLPTGDLTLDPDTSGRVRVYVSVANGDGAPADSNWDEQDTSAVFGLDTRVGKDGTFEVRLDTAGALLSSSDDETSGVAGYPLATTSELPRGVPLVAQAEFVVYDTYERKGMPAVELPTSCVSNGGSNGRYLPPDGTLRSGVHASFTLPEGDPEPVEIELELTTAVEAPPSPGCAGLGEGVDTEYMRTVDFKSPSLSDFWGRDIVLNACVLLPFGFEDLAHANASYPLVVAHGHYSPEWFAGPGWAETPPECDPAVDGYDCVEAQYAYHLYQNWTSADFSGSRMLVVTINHPVPLFDDSYAIDSANLGPYGTAINKELVPEIESRFRGIGAGWARGLFGGSTGGWESAATLIMYPDDYAYAHAACPDPVAFSHFCTADMSPSSDGSKKNAFVYPSAFKSTPRPAERDGYSGNIWPGYGVPYGDVVATIQESNMRELALGARSRSCGQWDIWEAVFGPACDEGYPCRAYDKRTGDVNMDVAEYWKENFDLAHIVETNWDALAPKLAGKLHLFVGGSDSYYLTDAVIDFEAAVKRAAAKAGDSDPMGGISIEYGAYEGGLGFQHCFSGTVLGPDGEPLPNSVTRLTYVQRVLPLMGDSFAANAPPGADVASWRY